LSDKYSMDSLQEPLRPFKLFQILLFRCQSQRMIIRQNIKFQHFTEDLLSNVFGIDKTRF